MANGGRMTHKQHTVPITYLRGFSEDGENAFFYDVIKKKESTKTVPLNTLCFQKDVYELKDADGDYYLPNYIEKALGELETLYQPHYKLLKKKAIIENRYTKRLFTEDEKAFWITFMVIQMLRSPIVLTEAKAFCSENLPSDIDPSIINALALSLCLPFFKELKEDDQTILSAFAKPMLNMEFRIGIVGDNSRLVTSDNPVWVHSTNGSGIETDRIVFPIDLITCLYLVSEGYKGTVGRREQVFVMDSDDITEELQVMAFNAGTQLYYSKALDKRERRLIRIARQDRKNEDLNKAAMLQTG